MAGRSLRLEAVCMQSDATVVHPVQDAADIILLDDNFSSATSLPLKLRLTNAKIQSRTANTIATVTLSHWPQLTDQRLLMEWSRAGSQVSRLSLIIVCLSQASLQLEMQWMQFDELWIWPAEHAASCCKAPTHKVFSPSPGQFFFSPSYLIGFLLVPICEKHVFVSSLTCLQAEPRVSEDFHSKTESPWCA